MADETIIDLGYAEPLDPTERALGTTVERGRLIGVGLLVLVCLIALGGAALPPAPSFTQVGLITWTGGPLRDDYLPSPIAGLVLTAIDGEVLAYHHDGSPAWRSQPALPPTEEQAFYNLAEWDGSILLMRITLRRIADGVPSSASIESVALEPATGRERWRLQGAPRRIGDLVMVSGDPWEHGQSARIYRSLPGDLIWSVPPTRVNAVDPATDTLATLTDEGLFTEYQLSTGAVRRSARLRLPHVASAGQEELTMRLFPDRVSLRANQYSPEQIEQVISYDRATLQPALLSLVDQVLGLQECGPVLCASTFERVYILDKDSLTELWRARPDDFPTWTNGGLLLQSNEPRLVDERTGRTLVDISGWEIVYTRPGFYEKPTFALLIRRVAQRTYVARLKPQAIDVLGAIPQGLRECQADDDVLLCKTDDGKTALWRHNPRI